MVKPNLNLVNLNLEPEKNKMIGTKIRELRKGKSINQAEFARRIGVTQGFISMTENNCRVPSQELIETIAKELNVETSEFTISKETNEIIQLISLLSGLNSQQISILKQIAMQFKGGKADKKDEPNFNIAQNVETEPYLKVYVNTERNKVSN